VYFFATIAQWGSLFEEGIPNGVVVGAMVISAGKICDLTVKRFGNKAPETIVPVGYVDDRRRLIPPPNLLPKSVYDAAGRANPLNTMSNILKTLEIQSFTSRHNLRRAEQSMFQLRRREKGFAKKSFHSVVPTTSFIQPSPKELEAACYLRSLIPVGVRNNTKTNGIPEVVPYEELNIKRKEIEERKPTMRARDCVTRIDESKRLRKAFLSSVSIESSTNCSPFKLYQSQKIIDSYSTNWHASNSKLNKVLR